MDTLDKTTQNTKDTPKDTSNGKPAVIEPRFYELSYVLRGGLEEGRLLEIAGSITSAITNLHGIVVEEGRPQPMRLAYEIEKQSDGYKGWIKFLIKHEELAELQKSLNSIKEIIRVRISKTQKAVGKKPQRAKRTLLTPKEDKADAAEIDKKLEELLG